MPPTRAGMQHPHAHLQGVRQADGGQLDGVHAGEARVRGGALCRVAVAVRRAALRVLAGRVVPAATDAPAQHQFCTCWFAPVKQPGGQVLDQGPSPEL